MRTPSDPMHQRLAATRASARHSSVPKRTAEVRGPTAVVTAAPTVAPERGDLERVLIEILLSPPDARLTAREAFAHKEQSLCAAIAAAPVMEVWTLHKRLSTGRSDDALANALQRLAPERRTKVVAFMADARRRDALRVA